MRGAALAAALALLLGASAGCRSSYDGPSFAGDWVASPAGVTTLTLTLTQDLGAWLDAPVRGELTDASGRTWTLKGEPTREAAQGVVRGRPLRVGLGAPLRLVTDAGLRRDFDAGPLPWSLVRGALPTGQEAITLHVGQAGPLWSGVEPGSWVHCTFTRPGAPPAVAPPRGATTLADGADGADGAEDSRACAGCGRPLEAGWRHCPDCGARAE